MNKLSCAIAGVFAAFLMTSATRAGIIDDFGDTDAYPPPPGLQLVEGDSVGLFSDTDVGPLSNVFGDGSRTLQLQVTVNPDPGGAIALTQVLPATQRWSTSNDPTVNSIARAIYTASGSGATLLPPGGNPSNTLFKTTVMSIDQFLNLMASFTDVNGYTASFSWTGLLAGDVSRPLSDFTLSNPAFDFAHVTGITVEMSGPSEWDGSLGRLETESQGNAIPEPSSLLLGMAVTGVVGLVAARRRRKRL